MSIQKIKLVLVKSYSDSPMFSDTIYKNIEFELPDGWDQAHILSARSYEPEKTKTSLGGDINTTVVKFENESDIVGKMLTLADMSFSDKEQREAFKTVTKKTLYDYFNHMRNNAIKCVDAQEHEEQKPDANSGNYTLK